MNGGKGALLHPGKPELTYFVQPGGLGLQLSALTLCLCSPARVLICKGQVMVPESAKDPLLPQPPLQRLGSQQSNIQSGVTAQAVYFSNLALPHSIPTFNVLYFASGLETLSITSEAQPHLLVAVPAAGHHAFSP